MKAEEQTSAARRRGAQDSASGAALMDAVEAVMRQDGYAALTARRVAGHAKLNYQLVFYYFGSMDELLLATYRRHIGRYREAAKEALQSDRPLHAYWAASSKLADAVLNMEFIALSNHNELIRAETVMFGEELRTIDFHHVAPALQEATAEAKVTPAAIVMVLNYVGSLLSVESALGIQGVHSEIRALVDWCVDRLESDR
ncbi:MULTISPECIES: TetR/AcrR family transcriptional regulator [unclassified Novosphingobium]|uniref:TetR/AcrR family transcriptional regulator n=1 Tax=unclassified Novosphingobium TaxID=2644732 RepID=UPI0013577E42|nr:MULTISPECIES: TetR/AcrR family transcriptional regulator [unclassified Novosphingobium]